MMQLRVAAKSTITWLIDLKSLSESVRESARSGRNAMNSAAMRSSYSATLSSASPARVAERTSSSLS